MISSIFTIALGIILALIILVFLPELIMLCIKLVVFALTVLLPTAAVYYLLSRLELPHIVVVFAGVLTFIFMCTSMYKEEV